MSGFADLPESCRRPAAPVVILPVPFDATSTWRKGADRGPQALIDASAQLELYDIETETEVYRLGIHTAEPVNVSGVSPQTMVTRVQAAVADLLAHNRFVATLGGEHSVTIGAVAAHAERFSDLTVLQLDAHADLRDTYEGSPYNHACVMARCRERCPIVQVGIRSMDRSELARVAPDCLFPAASIQPPGEDWMDRVVDRLTDNVYVTVDLDVLDPSIMPSTGTPEPGGLRWYPVLRLLRKVAAARTIVGADIVELCPNPANPAPDFLAAKLLYKLLTYRFLNDETIQVPSNNGTHNEAS